MAVASEHMEGEGIEEENRCGRVGEVDGKDLEDRTRMEKGKEGGERWSCHDGEEEENEECAQVCAAVGEPRKHGVG